MSTQAEAAQMIGKYVGDYQITAQLGEGGMGVVFKGVHPTLGQVVAVKMLHPNLVKADSIKQRFLREAQAMARLRHQNILQLYNFIDSDDGCFIVMEYVEGQTFEDVLEKEGALAPLRALELFVPVLRAMQFAHQNEIIHRDIKPSNLMVLNNGNVKVMDFGTAKMTSGPQLTAAGMTLGTVVYMSPEQLMGRDLSPQADIYSLGVTLYEMITGRLPFYHENEMTLMKMIMKEQAPPPSSVLPGIAPGLEQAIMRAVAKDRAQRYNTCEEFAQELERVRAQLAGPAPAPTPPPQPAPQAPPPGRPQMPPPPAQQADVEQTTAIRRPLDATSTSMHHAHATGAGGVNMALVIVGVVLLVLGMAAFAVVGVVLQQQAIGFGAGGLLFVVGLVVLLLGVLKGGGPKQVAYVPPPGVGPPMGAPAAPAGTKCLEVIEGPNRGERYELNEGAITIGRAPNNTIVFKDPSVSSHHGRIDFYQGKYFLSDLQSSNGTYVNNNRVEQTELKPKDLIAMGSSRVIVHL